MSWLVSAGKDSALMPARHETLYRVAWTLKNRGWGLVGLYHEEVICGKHYLSFPHSTIPRVLVVVELSPTGWKLHRRMYGMNERTESGQWNTRESVSRRAALIHNLCRALLV